MKGNLPFSEFNIELQEEINEKMGYWVFSTPVNTVYYSIYILWQG